MPLDLARCSDGWYTDLDCERLYTVAIDAPPGAFVEIGTYRGRSAGVLAQADSERELWLFDNCADSGVRDGDWPKGPHIHHVLFAPEQRDIERVGPIAVLHIDGNHARAAVLHDLELLGPSVVLDGVIVLHDFGQPNHDDRAGGEVRQAWFDWILHEDFAPIFVCREQAAFRRIR